MSKYEKAELFHVKADKFRAVALIQDKILYQDMTENKYLRLCCCNSEDYVI